MSLTLRTIGPDDCTIYDCGQLVGRIRLFQECGPWHWMCVVLLPSPPSGQADTFEDGQKHFKAEWEAFRAKHTVEELAKAFSYMNHAHLIDRHLGQKP